MFWTLKIVRPALIAAAAVALPASGLATDRLAKARLAAVEGDHALCAKVSDDVRKSNTANWYAHQVYASCQALNARDNRATLGFEKYKLESMKAIDAIEDIVTNGRTLTSRQRIKFSHMAVEMRKQLKRDLNEMKTSAQ